MRKLWRADLTRPPSTHRTLFGALLFGGDTNDGRELADADTANLVSSECDDGLHMPVVDLDVPHELVESTTPGHGHLYLDVPMRFWRYAILLWGLYQAGVIERGFFWWALRRRATFVRPPHVRKQPDDVSYVDHIRARRAGLL
jgi:hypothetical protein